MLRWTLDDPNVAYPTYAKIDEYARKDNGAILKKYPGFRNLSIHKGLSTNGRPRPASSATRATFPRPRATGRSSTSSSTTRASGRASGC